MSPGLRALALVAVISGLLFLLPSPAPSLTLALSTCLVVQLSAMMLGSLVVGLAGALVGVIVGLLAGSAYSPLLGATLAFVVGLDRSRQRRGQPAWFASTWLLAAGLLLPLAIVVLVATSRHRSVDLLPAMSISLLILGAVGSAVVGLGRRGQPAVDGWTILNSLAGYATFGLCCLSLLVLLPLLRFLPQRQRLLTTLMRSGMRLVLNSAPGVSWKIRGDPVPLAEARVVVANHHSVLDILCLCALPGAERTFLAKAWVLRAPLLGWVARACGIVSTEAVEAADFLSGRSFAIHSMAIFPSGRREDDLTTLRFRPGAFVLASTWQTPVLPIALSGTMLALPRSSWWIRPSQISIEVLPPLPKDADESVRQYAERCRILIEEARTRQLIDDLGHDSQRRWLNLWTIGHGPRVRQAMREEHRAHRQFAELLHRPADARPWLILGLGWSATAHTLRLLYPHTPLLAVEPDRRRREVALASWFRPATDHLEAALPNELPLLAGIIITVPVLLSEPTLLSSPTGPTEPLRRACDARTQVLVDARWAADWARLLAFQTKTTGQAKTTGQGQTTGDRWWHLLASDPAASAIEPVAAPLTVSP